MSSPVENLAAEILPAELRFLSLYHSLCFPFGLWLAGLLVLRPFIAWCLFCIPFCLSPIPSDSFPLIQVFPHSQTLLTFSHCPKLQRSFPPFSGGRLKDRTLSNHPLGLGPAERQSFACSGKTDVFASRRQLIVAALRSCKGNWRRPTVPGTDWRPSTGGGAESEDRVR